MAEVEASSRTPTITEPRVEMQQASRVVARHLRIDRGRHSVVSRHQQRFIDGTPWSLQTSFYPMALVLQGATQLIQATDIDGGAVAYLAETLGIKQAGYRDSIAVRAPNETETSVLQAPRGRAGLGVRDLSAWASIEDGTRFRLTVHRLPDGPQPSRS